MTYLCNPNSSMICRHSQFIIPPNDVKEDLLEIGAVKLDILDSGYNLNSDAAESNF